MNRAQIAPPRRSLVGRAGVLAGTIVLALALLVGCGSDDPEAPEAPDDEISAIVEDLNSYWQEADEDLGFDYEPVPLERISNGRDGALCNRMEIRPSEVADNAFVDPSCDEGILVAYDPDYLDDSLARAEATLAHEWGHVIQAQAEEIDLSLDDEGLPIDAELQADCLAGAWAAERAEAEFARLRRDVIEAGDPEGVGVDDPHAHGTAQERAAAFDVGLDGGPVACIDELIDALPE